MIFATYSQKVEKKLYMKYMCVCMYQFTEFDLTT